MAHKADKKTARGFTLIEQVIALTTVGGAIALSLPQATALHAAAQSSTLASLAAAAQSAMALNQAGCAISAGVATPHKCQPVQRCEQVVSLMLFDLAGAYRLQAALVAADAGLLACTLTQTDTGLSLGFTGPAVRTTPQPLALAAAAPGLPSAAD